MQLQRSCYYERMPFDIVATEDFDGVMDCIENDFKDWYSPLHEGWNEPQARKYWWNSVTRVSFVHDWIPDVDAFHRGYDSFIAKFRAVRDLRSTVFVREKCTPSQAERFLKLIPTANLIVVNHGLPSVSAYSPQLHVWYTNVATALDGARWSEDDDWWETILRSSTTIFKKQLEAETNRRQPISTPVDPTH